MNFFETPIWAFLSLVLVAWVTQRITSAWERRKKIEETRLELFMSWQPFMAEMYACAIYPEQCGLSRVDILKRKMEILGSIQLMGPDDGLEAASSFFALAEAGMNKHPDFDSKALHRAFGDLNFVFCCEIHKEK